MSNVLKVTPNEDGKYIVTMYGTDSDITDLIEKNIPTVTLYGEEYQIEVVKKDPEVEPTEVSSKGKRKK